ncbi:GmrSD restriction endonuclease domain-containing protein [Megamonas hypermegale]|uniref:GmrSD restriction endonuclease domain-containing protein n=1 Tax=Megamonas hypermegale TaxID=158847 RepID=UPI0026EFDD65|nr:DUF262 domain-containing protein [Megamonas hypermegale]
MNINKQLLEAANLNPTKNSRQEYIFTLCEYIEKNELTLPLYQRDMSWTLQKCVDLLNYQLLSKSPISAISINIINNTSIEFATPQVSFIEREMLSCAVRGQMSVVDGQQRLTTNYKAYCNHPDLKNVVLDLGKGEFIINTDNFRKNQVPVGILLNKDDTKLIEYTEQNEALSSPIIVNALLQIRNKIKTYQYTINFATDLSEDEQINWFEVLNNAGSRVSIIQMRFSKLKVHGIDVYTQYTHIYRSKILEYGYDYFTPQKTNVSYPIAALNPAYELLISGYHSNNFAPISSDTKENQLCKLRPEELLKCFNVTLEALDKVLNFIEDNNLKKHNRSDYINYLIGYFVFHRDEITEKQKDLLINWYNTVNFVNKSNTERRKLYANLLKL